MALWRPFAIPAVGSAAILAGYETDKERSRLRSWLERGANFLLADPESRSGPNG